MHFATYMILDKYLDFASIVTDIARRPFITIGMAGLFMLIPLALTSNNWSIRKLGHAGSDCTSARLRHRGGRCTALCDVGEGGRAGADDLYRAGCGVAPLAAVALRFNQWRRERARPNWRRAVGRRPHPHDGGNTALHRPAGISPRERKDTRRDTSATLGSNTHATPPLPAGGRLR